MKKKAVQQNSLLKSAKKCMFIFTFLEVCWHEISAPMQWDHWTALYSSFHSALHSCYHDLVFCSEKTAVKMYTIEDECTYYNMNWYTSNLFTFRKHFRHRGLVPHWKHFRHGGLVPHWKLLLCRWSTRSTFFPNWFRANPTKFGFTWKSCKIIILYNISHEHVHLYNYVMYERAM